MEIERKFLVRCLPQDLDSFPHEEIEQGYLSTDPTLRVRRYGDRYILTVKEHVSSEGAIVNREEEFAMSSVSYSWLLLKCDGRVLTKIRYRIPIEGGYVAELDIFSGRHQGLMLVEVEFPDVLSAESFVAPSWFGEDVSHDPLYRNSALSSIPNTLLPCH